MVAVTLREPRPGTGGAKKADFMRPGATVTLVALAPEARFWEASAQMGSEHRMLHTLCC